MEENKTSNTHKNNDNKKINKASNKEHNNKSKKNIKNNNTNNSKNKNKNKNMSKKTNNKKLNNKGNIKIIPLGGIGEIGANITVLEYENDIIVIDCGLSFPEDDMLGIDIVIPDISYLERNKSKIRGMVITHGHEDHIGAIPYVMKKLNMPIYATPLTEALILSKLKEHKLDKKVKLNTVHFGDVITLGKFSVEYIASAHSIPDAAMLAIRTPAGTIVHTGDFKVELTPVDGKKMDLARLGEIGKEGVLALLSDSTNAERPGFTMSEKSVGNVLDKLFDNCKKRIILATFASNVNRVQELVKLAEKHNRKIAVSGRSMEKILDIARELNYIDAPDRMFVNIDAINSVEDEHLLIITTGSQGEPMSALTRIATGQHRKIKLTQNDMVIISATPIPGNEPAVSRVINSILKRGVEVVYSALEHVHVSGHACQEEQKLIINLVNPKYFIPVHGEMRQLQAHKNSAMSMGYTNNNIILPETGRIIEGNVDIGLRSTGKVETGQVFVDGLGVGDVGNIVLRDRKNLSQDGIIIAVINLNNDGTLETEPDIISRGFVYVRESEQLVRKLKQIVIDEIEELETTEWNTVKAVVKNKLSKYIMKTTKRDPIILPIIV